VSPIAHLFASWLIAAKTTRHARDCRLATLAGLLPDADGLGLVVDIASDLLGYKPTQYYALYHHYWLHGFLGAVIISLGLAALARDKLRVALVAFLLFRLHVLCDFVGSRGPSPDDLWPIFYFGPFDKDPMWLWKGQWRLDGWQNQTFTVICFVAVLWLATREGHSPLGVFNRRADQRFVSVLREWTAKLKQWFRAKNE
jgi:inner membrane protein